MESYSCLYPVFFCEGSKGIVSTTLQQNKQTSKNPGKKHKNKRVNISIIKVTSIWISESSKYWIKLECQN